MGLIVQSWVRNEWALWASRLALFSIQLFFVGFILHRFQLISTPLALGLLAFAGALAVLGGVLACIAFVQIWKNGGRGGLRGTFAVLVALLVLALPASYLSRATSLPRINDISTDLVDPPSIMEVDREHITGGFLVARRDGPRADLQQAGYPDLQPVIVSRSVAAAFDAARTIVKREGLQIVLEIPPKSGRSAGLIQAIDETLLMGFRDDVVIRVRPQGARVRIDVRSASRYGQHDFGRNAQRIREISRQLKARLDFALPASLEDDDDLSAKTATKKVKRRKRVTRVKRLPSPRVRKKRRRRSRSNVQRGQSQTTGRQE